MGLLRNDTFVSQSEMVFHAYEHVKTITRLYAKTFYFASHFLPKEKRNACFAVYGFCRFVDDIIDESPQDDVNTLGLHVLEQWQKALDYIYKNTAADLSDDNSLFISELVKNNPVLIAWADTLRKYHIPQELPTELISGIIMDTTFNRFDTFEHLYKYCYKVASVVGLMTSEIFGYSEKIALSHAIDLGIAMQLTNICRDVGEDADKNRIYLPSDECISFGLSQEDILNKRRSKAFSDLIEFQIERALRYYESADKGIPYLSKDSRLTVQLMSTNYRRILYKIRKNNYDVFTKRASLSVSEKVLAVPRALIRNFVS